MGINFHDENVRNIYTNRKADSSWVDMFTRLVPVEDISNALDVGCGGGIYSKALADVGIDSITGIDFSKVILEGAKENCKGYSNISFKHGHAYQTGLDSNSFDLVLERALIHHIKDLQACFNEAYRVLNDHGIYVIQDRIPEDCLLQGSDTHIRGYFFELFPRLAEKEKVRRYDRKMVMNNLKIAGFKDIEEVKLWEIRKVYENKKQLLKDLSDRTGRSILHELNNSELQLLIDHIDDSISVNNDIIEKDRWTIWKAVKG